MPILNPFSQMHQDAVEFKVPVIEPGACIWQPPKHHQGEKNNHDVPIMIIQQTKKVRQLTKLLKEWCSTLDNVTLSEVSLDLVNLYERTKRSILPEDQA